MRAFLFSIMAVALIAALFLGNCLSCPQLLLAQQKHGCCPHSRHTSSDCTAQALKNFVKAEKSSVATPVASCCVSQADVFEREAAAVEGPRAPLTFAALPLQASLRI
jgi:hypothetical protein